MRRWLGSARNVSLMVLALVAGLLAVTALPPAAAQEPTLPCGMTADRTVSPSTTVVGQPVHVTVMVTGTCTGGAKGIDIFFVVDRSVTMFDKKYLDPTKNALTRFVNLMSFPESQGGLITFAANDNVGINLTSDRDALIQAIKNIRLSQETDVRGLQGAFRTATQKLDGDGSPGNEKVIMILVAGPDVNQAMLNMPTVTQAARNAGVKVIFLMFPSSQYLHYVEASTDCTGNYCGVWGSRAGVISKWAWGIDLPGQPNDVEVRLKTLAGLLLSTPSLASVEIYDSLSGFFEWIPGSGGPPPTSSGNGQDLQWQYTTMPAGGLKIEYDLTPLDEGRFKTAIVTRVDVALSNSVRSQLPLPNPEILVLDPGAVSPTPPPPTAITPATPTATTAPVTDTPSPTATTTVPLTPTPEVTVPVSRHYAYLPWSNKP
jgi:hypothetical protein